MRRTALLAAAAIALCGPAHAQLLLTGAGPGAVGGASAPAYRWSNIGTVCASGCGSSTFGGTLPLASGGGGNTYAVGDLVLLVASFANTSNTKNYAVVCPLAAAGFVANTVAVGPVLSINSDGGYFVGCYGIAATTAPTTTLSYTTQTGTAGATWAVVDYGPVGSMANIGATASGQNDHITGTGNYARQKLPSCGTQASNCSTTSVAPGSRLIIIGSNIADIASSDAYTWSPSLSVRASRYGALTDNVPSLTIGDIGSQPSGTSLLVVGSTGQTTTYSAVGLTIEAEVK